MVLSTEQRREIWTRANDQNHTYGNIADDIGCSRSTVSRWAQKDKEKVFDDETHNTQSTTDTTNTPQNNDNKDGNTTSHADTDNNQGVKITDVKPKEQDTRKNKDDSGGSEFVSIDPNNKQQVKAILQNTGISDPNKAQKFLWSCMTGNNKVNTEFSKIRLRDAELKK